VAEEQGTKQLDLGNLSDEHKALFEKLRFTINTPGWKEVIQPNIAIEHSKLLQMWMNSTQEARQGKVSDDWIKGAASKLEWVGEAFVKLLVDYDREQIRLEQERQEAENENGDGFPGLGESSSVEAADAATT
jgi:hypothetical protein